MQVIFLKDVPKVGKRHDVKEFADGYAQNVLIAKGLAERATPHALDKLNAMKNSQKKKQEEENLEFDGIISKINSSKVIINAPANEKGHLFKSINKKEISDSIFSAIGSKVPEEFIEIGVIKEIGSHEITIKRNNKIGKCKIEILAK